jgi:hypothetical protein
MSKTRIQNQRPVAKGKHQRPSRRWSTRENPPLGINWGSKVWPGSGAGTPTPFAQWVFDVATAAAGILAGEVRYNNVQGSLVTHVFVSKTPASGTDPTASWAVNDPLRVYYLNDTSMWIEFKITAVTSQTGYWDYTVTYTANSGGFITPPDGTQITLIERTTVPGADPQTPTQYDPTDHNISEVQDYVNGLPMDDQRAAIIQAILDLERAGKNRSTLETWLDQQLGVV